MVLKEHRFAQDCKEGVEGRGTVPVPEHLLFCGLAERLRTENRKIASHSEIGIITPYLSVKQKKTPY